MLHSKKWSWLKAWAIADRQAPRHAEGDRGPGASIGRDVHRIWVDGTEFRCRDFNWNRTAIGGMGYLEASTSRAT
jgi:hypothetical protein